MTTLRFYQIFPQQKPPLLANGWHTSIPRRAQLFCHPFKAAMQQGCLAFSPVNFSFKCSTDTLQLKIPDKENPSNEKTLLTVDRNERTNHQFVTLGDVDADLSQRCLGQYRQRIPRAELPEGIELDEFGFYEVMINVFTEEAPYGFFLQIWLGGVLETSNDNPLLIKSAVNASLNSGFQCLDAVVDTTRWKGWLAIVIQPTQQDCWITIDQNTPLCQIIGLNEPITACETIPFDEVDDAVFLEPLRWHLFDPKYSRKPGKYQRLMEKT